jgi:pyruvate dehydrogenase E1 component alpha subunit
LKVQLSREELLRAYRQMKVGIREFEERLHIDIQTGRDPGFTHLYSGQEAVAVGVCEHLSTADRRSSRRTAATATASPRAATCNGMMAEICGQP